MSSAGGLNQLAGDQKHGADPTRNVWLSASAGTGKTQVLTARVLRLLLDGVDPSAILCITFTKAGAAEMGRRVRDVLARWVQLPVNDLRKDLMAIGARHLDDATLATARTLFARVIDAPGGGLAIQTIHSFCQSLLAAFPLEAGLVPGFRPLEDRDALLLRRQVLTELVDQAPRTGHLSFLAQLGDLALRHGEDVALRWLDRCAAAGPALEALPGVIGPWLRDRLALPDGTADGWLKQSCADNGCDVTGLRLIADANAAWATKTGLARAEAIREWLALDAEARAARLDLCVGALAKDKGRGEIFADYAKPAFAEVQDLVARCLAQLQGAAAVAEQMAASDRLADAFDAGRHFARGFAAAKHRQGVVDFDDLIRHTVALVQDGVRADWIRYKLDRRLDHILVDEAQDTNLDQWSILAGLTAEYFATAPEDDPRVRTVFVVGDYKQAIYGFQGTDPQNFAAARLSFEARGREAERPFAPLAIDVNFRSSRPVLAAVDRVIERLGPDALGLDLPVAHTAFADRAPGRVVLWPPEPAARAAGDGEDADDDADGASEEGWIDDATRRIADRIARTVRHWIDHGLDGEAVRAGDVMVLVRKRATLAALIVARLQEHGVPVAGVDRLRLHQPIAVQDLLAAARFALQPLDDLNLAALLVSPLGGWTQDELWQFGHRPHGTPLWPHLRDQAGLRERLAPLRDLLRMADFVTPYRFFETILSGPMQGRARLLARLGNAARDPIEELASAALQFETREGPSLHRFLQWFDSGEIELKRDVDAAADEARVMTVHGAKGLEARIVILADATGDPDSGGNRAFAWDAGAGKLPIIGMGAKERPPVLAAAAEAEQQRERREHWRLLYVAMTRARRMLFVAGALGKRDKDGPKEASWYAAIAGALDDLGAEDRDDPTGLWGGERIHAVAGREAAAERKPAPPLPPVIPDWARAAPPDEPRPLRPLSPSMLGDEVAAAQPQPPPGAAQAQAAERGRLMHALFERLPAVAVAERAAAGERWLAVRGAGFDAAARSAMLAQVLNVLAAPDHAALFGPDSLAEVPFSALVDGRVIAGTVDRLVVTADAVAVIDYKTGLGVPASADAVPTAYLRQMAAYVAALSVVFPGRPVSASLLFTSGPRLITLPDALLAAHKPGLADG